MGSDLHGWMNEPSTVQGFEHRRTWLQLLKKSYEFKTLAEFQDYLTRHAPRPPDDDLIPAHLRTYP